MKDALIRLLILTNIALLIVAAAPKKPSVLTVSEIAVVDAKGVVRARLGGNLPPAMRNGKPVPRPQPAGLLLYDDTGQERGGYLTFPGRQVALTLDARDRSGQVVLLAADADGSSALTMTPDGKNVAEVRVDSELGPAFHAMKDNKVAFHVPPVTGFEKTEGCGEFRGALKQMSRAEVLNYCRRRLSEEACQACLGGQ